MIIGIDANEANQKNRVGIGQFAFNVVKNLEKIDGKNSYIVYLKEPPLSDLPKEREGWKYKIFGPGKLWTQIALPVKLFTQKEKIQLFYSPSHYAPRLSPFPTVISIMDLWHHRHPEQFDKKDLYQLIRWEKYSVEKAKKIITISEFSKSEIIKFYGVKAEKISVAYPGFDSFELNEKEDMVKKVKERFGIKKDYLLYLGTLQPKKNIEGIIQGFAQAKNTKDKLLIIAGKKGWHYERIFELVKKLKIEDKVIFPGFISEEEKPFLIAGASVFVFPSFYEGFGIPVLEAMSLKVPVVTSSEASLPEVGGKAAIYCNPYSIEEIAFAFDKALGLNKTKRNEIIALGLEQTKKFSWENCALTILKTFENI
ncbi:glycosyltransferase family 1 protein [Candidatus Microgenomates bacterium]|jgi:glycosyltransferase involved in cell wall biosynthesis|nr:MAG: glycosyltransferase family 1 protein [Candidatus Microgenomates bacterium]